MKEINVQVGQLVKSKNNGKLGIITGIDYTTHRDRFATMDIRFQDKTEQDQYYGFFLIWLYDDNYDGIEFLPNVASSEIMMDLTKDNVNEIIERTLNQGE